MRVYLENALSKRENINRLEKGIIPNGFVCLKNPFRKSKI